MHRIAFAVLISGVATAAMAGPRAGLIDPTFGSLSGYVTHGFDRVMDGADLVTAFAKDETGRIYLAGSVEDGDLGACLGVLRYSSEGMLDPA